MKDTAGFGTRAIHAGQSPDPTTGAIMTPVYMTSTYVQEAPGVIKGYDYSRTCNPTRTALEQNLASMVARAALLLVDRTGLIDQHGEAEPGQRRERRRALADDDAGTSGTGPQPAAVGESCRWAATQVDDRVRLETCHVAYGSDDLLGDGGHRVGHDDEHVTSTGEAAHRELGDACAEVLAGQRLQQVGAAAVRRSSDQLGALLLVRGPAVRDLGCGRQIPDGSFRAHVGGGWRPPACCDGAPLLVHDPAGQRMTDDVAQWRAEACGSPREQGDAGLIGPGHVTQCPTHPSEPARGDVGLRRQVDDEAARAPPSERQLDALTDAQRLVGSSVRRSRGQIVERVTQVQRGTLDGDPRDAQRCVGRVGVRLRPRHAVPPRGRAAPT